METKRIIVAGAGPAGMMAAIRAAQLCQDVTLLEKNPYPGKKLLLSGKGRCNLTNTCELESFLERFSRQGRFLRDAFKKFFHRDLMDFFASRGVGLKVERQLRVFPVSDSSASILEALKKELGRNKVRVLYRCRMKDVLAEKNRVKGLLLDDGKVLLAERIILATGGVSYPATGSTGEGLKIAQKLGHRLVPLKPGLVPLETKQHYPEDLAGLALKNIRLKFSDGQKEVDSGIGELLFTDFGISGPLVLTFSGRIVDWLAQKRPVSVAIDLKPALSKEQLHLRLLREFRVNPKKALRNTLKELMPKSLANLFLEIADINPLRKVGQVTKEEREKIVSLLKGLRLDIARARPISEAMVTRGGVSLKDINPRTMESRLIKGLYFCGEMIDVDADTGGFNLQAAFSTGYLAGESAGLS